MYPANRKSSETGRALHHLCCKQRQIWSKEVSRCYQEAQEVLKLKYVRGENQDLYYQDIENETGHISEDILKTDLITL